MTDQQCMIEAAHHEAGHVVVGYCHDIVFRRLMIRFCQEKGRWVGNSGDCIVYGQRGRRPQYRDDAKVSLAGMLAEAKAIAIHAHGPTIAFNADASLVDVIRFLGEEQSEMAPGNFLLDFRCTATRESFSLRFPGELCSGTDHAVFLSKRNRRHIQPQAAVIDTMKLLDRDSNWQSIQTIAKLLADQSPGGDKQERTLKWDQFSSFLPLIVSDPR